MTNVMSITEKADWRKLEDGVNYFVLCMHMRGFVQAHDRTCKRFGLEFTNEIEQHCFDMGVTYRGKDGRLHLSRFSRAEKLMKKRRVKLCSTK